MEIDPGDFEDCNEDFKKISWFTRMLIRFSLSWGISRLAKELGTHGVGLSKKAHAAFDGVERIDIIPAQLNAQSNTRGFEIILDNTLAIFFCQDGDHFSYDGFEIGAYGDGDVTIFDHFWEP